MKIQSLCLVLLLTGMPVLAFQPSSVPPGDDDEELARKIRELEKQINELRTRQNPLLEEQKTREEKKMEKEPLRQEEIRKKEYEAQQKEWERQRKEEEARQARIAALKKRQCCKVEVCGTLSYLSNGHVQAAPATPAPANLTGRKWQIAVNELLWNLDLKDNKELLAAAQKFANKEVIVKGKVATTKNILAPGHWVQPPLRQINPPPPPPPFYKNWPNDDPPGLHDHQLPLPGPGTVPLSQEFGIQPGQVFPPFQQDPAYFVPPVEGPPTIIVDSLQLVELEE